MLIWISSVCLYFVVDLPGNVCRVAKRFASNWWYSHYR